MSGLAGTSTGSNQARSVKNVSRCCGRVRAVGFRPVYRVFFSRVRYLLSNLMSHVCLDRLNGSFTICIHTNSYDSIAFPLSKYCVEMLILWWDHSKLSTYKSTHTSSIWGVTWNRWSHSSIYNKNDANNIFSDWYKIGFEIKNEIEGQCQSSPKFSGILTVLRCICGPNLEILSWIGGEWWHGQAQNMVIFHCEVKFDLEVQGQLPPKTIGILTKVFCSSGPNLVILAWTCDKLSRGQASDYRTHRRTHRQTQATTIPEGQNWPRVKTQ